MVAQMKRIGIEMWKEVWLDLPVKGVPSLYPTGFWEIISEKN